MDSTVESYGRISLIERLPLFSSICPLADSHPSVDSRALDQRPLLKGLDSLHIAAVVQQFFCREPCKLHFWILRRLFYRGLSEIKIHR